MLEIFLGAYHPARTDAHFRRLFAVIRAYLDDLDCGRFIFRPDSNAATLRREKIPRASETGSRVAIIANEWRTLNVNVSAIEDRGHVVRFAPSALEIHTRTAQWFWDQEVYDFIGQYLHLTDCA